MSDETEPLDPAERPVADLLAQQRPHPAPRFRGGLRQRLAALDPGFGPRPANLWVRVLALVAVGTVLLLLGAARAVAAGRVTVEPGLTVGFSGADPVLASGDAATTAKWDPLAHAVGTQIIRLDVSWASIAPATPPPGFNAADPSSAGYNWTSVDTQVRELSQAGFQILLNTYRAPSWAVGPGAPASASPGAWNPSAYQYSLFAHALAERYSGRTPDPVNPGSFLPRIHLWQAWNEPNLDIYLAPQWARNGRRFVPVAPTLYRNLLNAFYGAVKRVSSANYVVAAGTAPYGDPVGGTRMPPVTFDQYLFCLNTSDRRMGCTNPPHLNAIDHHPYGVAGPFQRAYNSYDVAIPDLGKLEHVLAVAQHDHTVLPAGHKGLWVTEVSWNTNPPNPGGVPVTTEARWVSQALYELWSEHISTVLWYQLADTTNLAYVGGVYYVNGQPKPLAQAFTFPLYAFRRAGQTIAWTRAPAAGTLQVQVDNGSAWQTLERVRVRAREVLEVALPAGGQLTLRAELGAQRSLPASL